MAQQKRVEVEAVLRLMLLIANAGEFFAPQVGTALRHAVLRWCAGTSAKARKERAGDKPTRAAEHYLRRVGQGSRACRRSAKWPQREPRGQPHWQGSCTGPKWMQE